MPNRQPQHTLNFEARCGSRQTRLERFGERGAVEVFADEDEGVGARVLVPFAVELGVEEHVHALEDEALVRAFHGQHAFHPVNVATLGAERDVQHVLQGVEPLPGFVLILGCGSGWGRCGGSRWGLDDHGFNFFSHGQS